jgi:hypothetical protein
MNGTNFLLSSAGSATPLELSKKELFSLQIETLTPEQKERITDEFFKEDFGAISDYERVKYTTQYLYQKINDTLEMSNVINCIPWQRPLSLSALTVLDFLLIPLDCREFTHLSSPAIECYKNQYCVPGRCSALYHSVLAKKKSQYFGSQEIAFGEFVTKKINPKHPLQDLRDRTLRVMTMQKERTLHYIWVAYHQMQQKAILMNKIEEIPYDWTELMQLPTDDIINHHRFIERVSHTFSERKIVLNGRMRDVKIVGSVPGKTFFNCLKSEMDIYTVISIQDCITNECYGSIRFHKTWRVIDDEEPSSSQQVQTVTEKSYRPYHAIIPYAIVADGIFISTYESEEDGDLPLFRLMSQIMVEVLLRESINLLQITSFTAAGGVYYCSGFRGSCHDNTTRNVLMKARGKGNRFAYYSNVQKHTLEIFKINDSSSTSSVTRLHTRSEGATFPAYVYHTLDNQGETWENIINVISGPLLGDQKGPVLPLFNLKDLTIVQC